MKVFLINLDRSPDRLIHMQVQAQAVGITFERVTGIDGRTLVEPFLGNTFAEYLSQGQRGCYASHLLCCQKIVEQDIPYAMILEDDCDLAEHTGSVIENAVAAAPEGWDFIQLMRTSRYATWPLTDLTHGHQLVRFSRRPPYSAVGYLMSASGAKKFLKPRHRVVPNDSDVRRQWTFKFDVLGVTPGIVSHRYRFDSTADHVNELKSTHRRVERAGRVMDWAWRQSRLGLRGAVACAIVNQTQRFARREDPTQPA
jgi:glycosyl transferase, family 25